MSDDKKNKVVVVGQDDKDGYAEIRVPTASNSNRSKEQRLKESEPEKKLEKIISGKVVKKKKSFGKKVLEVFVGDDVTNVSSYVLYDVLIPAAKNTMVEMVQTGIEMMIFGEARSIRIKRDRNRSYVSYGSFYKGDREREKPREVSKKSRARHDFDDIILESRGEAEDVLERLIDLVDRYDQATVADLYDLVGISSNFTDTNYGWTNLSSAYVSRERNGYLIKLPRAHELD